MSVSRYSADRYWEEAVVSLRAENFIQNRKFELINASIEATFHLIHPFFGNNYVKAVTLQIRDKGKFSTVGSTGTFTAATSRLTHNFITNNITTVGFSVTDVESEVMVRIGGLVLKAYIGAYVNPTTVVLRGNNLPTSDAVVDSVLVANTLPDVNVIQLATLNINRLSTEKFILESSVTQFVEAISMEEFKAFNTTSLHNRGRIVYTNEKERIYFKAGSALASAGTLTLHYPCMPTVVVAGTDSIDVPDGVPIRLGIEHLRFSIRKQQGEKMEESALLAAFMPLLQQIALGSNREVSLEELSKKAKAIL